MGNSASAPKDSSNTVFISYRREPAWSIARSIFLALRDKNYDVFMDVEDIDNGQFDTVILNQIAARAHFLLILTPGTLDRCVSADDWVRREIEHAIDLQRNVVPVLVDNFNFVGTEQMLTGKLSGLPRYNALPLVPYYFDAGIDILHDRFLKQEVKGDIATVSDEEHAVVQQKIEKAANITVPPSPEPPPLPPVTLPSVTLPSVTLTPPPLPPNPFPPRPPNTPDFAQQAKELSAEGDFRGALNAYTSAIQLDPNNAEAYFGRRWFVTIWAISVRRWTISTRRSSLIRTSPRIIAIADLRVCWPEIVKTAWPTAIRQFNLIRTMPRRIIRAASRTKNCIIPPTPWPTTKTRCGSIRKIYWRRIGATF